MSYGTSVGPKPHTRQEASGTNNSGATCACGARAVGLDAQTGEPVCEECARLRCDGGDVAQVTRVPEHVLEATPDHILEQGLEMAAYEYEEKHLTVEHQERECRVCEGETHHRIETDEFRGRTAIVCSVCGETNVTTTDGGAVLADFTDTTTVDERPDDCDCAPCMIRHDLPCWPCYRDGFEEPNPTALEEDDE